jgi:predicted DNA-binding transcriptional regulator AlpA
MKTDRTNIAPADRAKGARVKSAAPALYAQDRDVGARYGVHHSVIWRWVQSDPAFPRPVALSPGTKRWRIADLENWERSKIERVA